MEWTTWASFFQREKTWSFKLYTNNSCNLHCNHCTNLGAIPIDHRNTNPYRKRSYVIPIKDIEDFCRVFNGIATEDVVFLIGGETTVLDTEFMTRAIDVFYRYNRINIQMRSNGFGILEYPDVLLKKFRGIELDNHGTNEAHILACQKRLESLGVSCSICDSLVHYDIAKSIETAQQNPKPFVEKKMFKAPVLFKRIIFPCRSMLWVEHCVGSLQLYQDLKASGFTLDNPDLIETLGDWRNRLPESIYDTCRNRCYSRFAKDFPHLIESHCQDKVQKTPHV